MSLVSRIEALERVRGMGEGPRIRAVICIFVAPGQVDAEGKLNVEMSHAEVYGEQLIRKCDESEEEFKDRAIAIATSRQPDQVPCIYLSR